MKTLTTIVFLLLATSLSYGQTAKPTVEETIQYIINELEEERIYTSHYRDLVNEDIWPSINKYMIYTNINMTSCILKITEENWTHNMSYGQENSVKVQKLIDFSKVESIGFIATDRGDNAKYIAIEFTSKTENNKMENIKIAIGLFHKDVDLRSLKLYKAFQHLRKLCDAPEPISFD